MAKLAGVHIVETSRFRWKDGRPEALAYDFHQETAFKQKIRHAGFDWKAGEVHVTEGDGDFRYPIAAGIIDRQAVTLALAQLPCPLSRLAGKPDPLTPPPQAFALADRAGTDPAEVSASQTSGGHLGLFMGREALQEHWAPLFEKLAARETPSVQV